MELINKKGYYLDQFNRVWFWNSWSNQPVVTLTLYGFKKELGFYRNGTCIGFENVTEIKKYLSPEKYPEYYV